jgi:hypothetical protein
MRAIPAAILVVVAAWELVRVERTASGVPDDAAWDRASAIVRGRFHAGDLIVFAPRWVDPVGRLHLGDLIPVDVAARMDGARFGSVWELSIRGARAPEAREGKVDFEVDAGGIDVRHVVREPAHVVTDFAAALGGARIAGARVQGPETSLQEVGFEPHRCVLVEPRPGQSVTITFPAAALGTELVGYVGLADVFTRRDVRAPGRLTVAIGGREVARATVGDDDGWTRFATPTTPGAADVTFTATAVGPGARDRLICFAAEARR